MRLPSKPCIGDVTVPLRALPTFRQLPALEQAKRGTMINRSHPVSIVLQSQSISGYLLPSSSPRRMRTSTPRIHGIGRFTRIRALVRRRQYVRLGD